MRVTRYDCGVFGTGLSRVWHLTLANTDGWTCGGWYGDVIAKPKISGIDKLTFTVSARLAELRCQEKHKSEPLSKEYPTVNQANRSWRLLWVNRFPPSPHILLVSFAYGLRLRSPVLSTLKPFDIIVQRTIVWKILGKLLSNFERFLSRERTHIVQTRSFVGILYVFFVWTHGSAYDEDVLLSLTS